MKISSSYRIGRSVMLSAAALATFGLATLTGCSALVETAGPTHSFDATGTMQGRIHGGNQPVGGATVLLYAAGASGYGSASTLYATTTSLSDGTGSFSFSKTGTGNTTSATNVYGCPTVGDPQMYLIATGGNTQGAGVGTNSAAGFLTVIGKCSTIGAGTFVNMNEVTTVATLASLLQYFNPVTESLGYPSSTQGTQGFANGVLTTANLANFVTGTANPPFTLSAIPTGSTTSVNVTVTPEYVKINTIANITAACVNTASSSTSVSTTCSTLFSNAYPPQSAAATSQPTLTFPTATDTIQATYNMLANPASESTLGTNNPTAMNNLFNLSGGSPPFQGSLATAPTDWTVGMFYTSTSPCTSGVFLTSSTQEAADASGNIWIASGGSSATSSNLIEIAPNGLPLTCTLGTSVAMTKGLTIDTVGNIWIAGNAASSSFYRYTPGTMPTTTTFATSNAPYAVGADGSGNVFYTDAANKQVEEFVGGANSTAAVTPTLVATLTSSFPYFLAIDTSGNLFIPNVSTTTSISEVYPSTATGNTNGYKLSAVGSTTYVYNPYAVAAGLAGNIYMGNSASSTATAAQTAYSFLPSTTGTVTYNTATAQYAGGLAGPRGPNAVDGAGNVWYANSTAATGNYVTGATTSGEYYLSEFTAALVPISPNTQSGGFQKDPTVLASNFALKGVTIDPSGNVWSGGNSSTVNGIFELVGAAVPVVTPISKALAAGITAATRDAVVKP